MAEAETVSPRYANSMEEIHSLVKAQVPLIWVLTHEENRFIDDFITCIAEPLNRDMWLWSAYQGLVRRDQMQIPERASGEEGGTNNPQKALEYITKASKPKDKKGTCFIMRDFHTVLAEPIPRQIRDMYQYLMDEAKTLVIVSPMLAHGPGGTKSGMPPTLEKNISIVRYELPTEEAIRTSLQESIEGMKQIVKKNKKGIKLDYTDSDIIACVRALQGMTLGEVENSVATSITHMDEINVNKLINDKRNILRKSEILEFIDSNVSFSDVGGLDLAKTYLEKYTKAYGDEAKQFGVEPLKGILLTGVPGTGKSLLAKAIGNLWQVPLLKLDVGKVMTGLVGGSESKMRDVISQAEAMSPCVLWIDEVEKSLSGTKSSNFSDGGTLARVFGTLLTAMQDGMDGVTIVATANDITMLPPEFIRRFNEVFFVDLPADEERWEIFKIHLSKRNRDISLIENDKDEILTASNDFTGAECEKAVKDAIAAAFYDETATEVETRHVVNALNDTKPIAKVMAEKIKKIRTKAKGQYRFSSSDIKKKLEKAAAVKTASGKKLDIDNALDDFDEFTSNDSSKGTQKNKKKSNRFQGLED